MGVYITGDCHGEWIKLRQFSILRELTEDDFIIVCGDFGIWNDTNGYETRGLDNLQKSNLLLYLSPATMRILIGCTAMSLRRLIFMVVKLREFETMYTICYEDMYLNSVERNFSRLEEQAVTM